MIRILGYAPASQIFATVEAINDMGAYAVSPRKVVMVRHEKNHRWDATDAPALETYLFAQMTEADWHRIQSGLFVQGKRVILRKVVDLSDRQWDRVTEFAQRVEMDYQHEMERIEMDRFASTPRPYVCPYDVGEALMLLDGELRGHMVRFTRSIEAGGVPVIEAEMQIMGQAVKVKVDPVKVKRWASE